jgi:hypothetical protein
LKGFPDKVNQFGPFGGDGKIGVAVVVKYGVLAGVFALANLLAFVSIAHSQNRISASGWEGFVTRDTENKFDRCVLYNKTIEALTISPYDMLGITRTAKGDIGLLVFFEPSALKRGNNIAVTLEINGSAVAPLTGQALSDFHIRVAGPIGAGTVAALRGATSIEATAEGRSVQFEVSDVGAVLDALDNCVRANAR